MERVIGRKVLGEQLLEVCFALFALLRVLVGGAGFVVEVAGTGDV